MNSLSETESACPLCGSTILGASEFEDHLEAHSKQDLIQLLLQQQTFVGSSRKYPGVEFNSISSTSSSRKSAVIDSISKGRESNNYIIPHHSRSIPSLQPLPFTLTNDEDESSGPGVEYAENENDDSAMVYSLGAPTGTTISVPFPARNTKNVKLESATYASTSTINPTCDMKPTESRTHHRVTKTRGANRPIIIEDISCQEITSESHHHHPDNSLTSTLPSDQDSQFRDVVREESDNATSQTSIIKYIIQSGKSTREELPEDPQDRWILPDGRTIPVYSSFNQLQIPRKYVNVKQMPRSESSKPGDGHIGQIEKAGSSLNLMADEEIPPRGEISEFEESNTSSLVSEDSKAALSSKKKHNTATSSPKKVIPIQKCKPKPKRRGGKQSDNSAGGQFLCYECPVMQSFKSLFELIGHKVKLHPSINITEQVVSDDTASSSLLLPPLSEAKEEIQQCQQINLNVPGKTPMEFFCVYCHATFDHRLAIAQHLEIVHGDKPPNPNIFECNTCGKIFPARTNLRKHLMVHKERKHVCTTCSKGFTSNFKLLEHARVHTKEYPFKCEICEKAYRTPSLLNHHAKTVHVPESERPPKPKIEFYCGVCHKILRSKRSYFCHIKSHQASPQKCPYCCETFGRQSVLVRHIRVTHDPQYESSDCKECTICQRKLHPNSLIKHMRIHANEKPYPCPVCSKRFRTYANLSSHSWSHTNVDRPFKCRVCPKSYLFKRTLEHHMMVHKKRTLHYVCNECGVRFTNKVNMKRHLDEHYSEKKYKCKTCGKKFQRNYYLLEHERTHSGLKPFLCNICGKASTTKSNHRAHIKIHDARDATSQEG